jgi:hypothetical protein
MIKDGHINLPHFGKMTLDHYTSVLQLAGVLSHYGFEEINIKHESDVDISAKIGGYKIAFEVEKYDNKSPDIWMKKKAFALENHDTVKFICSNTDAKIIVKVVGDKYLLKRGAAVIEYIESLAGKVLIHDSEMVSDECEITEA